MARIELSKVSKAFAPGAPVVNDISLDIAEGERLVVLGPSGSGKTTLLRLIAGLEAPDAGTLRIGGRDMAGVPPHRRDVAMVFQNPALYPHLNVQENLAFGLRARGVARSERRSRVRDVAEMLGLGRLLRAGPRGSPAASGSAWPWAARSCGHHGSCCSTSRSRTWMIRSALRSGKSCWLSITASVQPSCT